MATKKYSHQNTQKKIITIHKSPRWNFWLWNKLKLFQFVSGKGFSVKEAEGGWRRGEAVREEGELFETGSKLFRILSFRTQFQNCINFTGYRILYICILLRRLDVLRFFQDVPRFHLPENFLPREENPFLYSGVESIKDSFFFHPLLNKNQGWAKERVR